MVRMKKLEEHFKRTDGTDLKYMSYSSEALLQQAPGLSRLMLWAVCAFILLMVVWACFAQVDEFTRGMGKIVPSSDIQVVQNLEGGILAQLMVEEGSLVEKGQPLLQIDDTLVSSTFEEKSLQIAQLQVKAARLRAEANGTTFEEELDIYDRDFDPALVKREAQLYENQQREFQLRHSTLMARVEQKQQEHSSAKVNFESLNRSHRLLSREVAMTTPLVSEGAVSPVELLRLERQLNDLKGEMEKAELAVPQLLSEYEEARQNVETYEQTFTGEARKELNEVTSELGRVQASNQAFADRVQRTVVRSPVRGTVKLIRVKTIGGVIQPGMDLVEIVPIDDSLLVDAKVKPSDIAFIHPGQSATVKFTAYDYSIHGGLPAKVVQISPDTIEDQEGNSFYQIRLVTESSHLGKSEDPLPIIPGMTTQVDILTGKKTVMDYLLKPILKTKELAFREK
ncbi:MAG: hemolysin secretion protein D [Porticoccaceae bacterium]|nr:hemolysin secretion protein D [Porticoccaceae bacterium]